MQKYGEMVMVREAVSPRANLLPSLENGASPMAKANWQPWSPKVASGVTAAGSHFVFADMGHLNSTKSTR
jgi:hypothetical protein